MNKMKQRFGVFLVIMSMAASMTAASDSAAAKLPKLSKNRVSVQAGKTVQFPLYLESPVRVGSVQAYISGYRGLRYPVSSLIR